MSPTLTQRRVEIGDALILAMRSLGLRYTAEEFSSLVENALIDYPRCVENYHLVADLKYLCERGVVIR